MDQSLRDREFERILLVKPSSLGDVIHALPVLRGLRRRYPNAHIAWLVANSFASLIRNHPDLDEVIEFDRKRFAKMGRSASATGEFFSLMRDLRTRKFDLVIDLQGLFRSGWFTRVTRSPVRIGFAEARELAPLFYTHKIPRSEVNTHAVDRNYLVSQMLGFENEPLVTDLAITDDERDRASALLAEAGLDGDAGFVAILPGARWETKKWLPDRFSKVIDLLKERTGMTTVLLGGPEEEELCGLIASQCETEPSDLTGRTSIRELFALLERASLVLCHDSGPMHIAAALDKPMVSIVGPTNPLRTGPYGHLDTVLRVDLECAPCYLRKLSQCRFNHACMEQLSPEEVLVRLTEVLKAD